jgi:hypothetical protein
MRTLLPLLVACLPYAPATHAAPACGTEPADAQCAAITTCCDGDACWLEAGEAEYPCASPTDCDAAIDLVFDHNCVS